MTELSTQVETMVFGGEGKNAVWSPLPAVLEFTTADPIAATLVLGGDDPRAVRWIFAFDLIYRASTGWSQVGVGDVRFAFDELDSDWLILRLSSPEGSATLRLRTLDVKKYVQGAKDLLDAQPSVDLVAESLEKAISAILED